jgi:hypothetical protein
MRLRFALSLVLCLLASRPTVIKLFICLAIIFLAIIWYLCRGAASSETEQTDTE